MNGPLDQTCHRDIGRGREREGEKETDKLVWVVGQRIEMLACDHMHGVNRLAVAEGGIIQYVKPREDMAKWSGGGTGTHWQK